MGLWVEGRHQTTQVYSYLTTMCVWGRGRGGIFAQTLYPHVVHIFLILFLFHFVWEVDIIQAFKSQRRIETLKTILSYKITYMFSWQWARNSPVKSVSTSFLGKLLNCICEEKRKLKNQLNDGWRSASRWLRYPGNTRSLLALNSWE